MNQRFVKLPGYEQQMLKRRFQLKNPKSVPNIETTSIVMEQNKTEPLSYFAFRTSGWQEINNIKEWILESNECFDKVPIVDNVWYILMLKVDIVKNSTVVIGSNKQNSKSRNVLYNSLPKDYNQKNVNISRPFLMKNNLSVMFTVDDSFNKLYVKLIKLEDWWRGISFNHLNIVENQFTLDTNRNYGSVSFVKNRPYLIFSEVYNDEEYVVDVVLAASGFDEQVKKVDPKNTVNIDHVLKIKVTHFDPNLIVAMGSRNPNNTCAIALVDILDCLPEQKIIRNQVSISKNYSEKIHFEKKGLYMLIGSAATSKNRKNTIEITHNSKQIYYQELAERPNSYTGTHYICSVFEAESDKIEVVVGDDKVELDMSILKVM